LPVEPLISDCPADLIASDIETGTPLDYPRVGLINIQPLHAMALS